MSNSKVTVVITTYNRSNYLKFAIDSVLNQTYDNFELIIVDDGSTDDTKQVVESYKDERIIYHYQKNAGQNLARNKGMELAKGKYIAHLDSDDIWMPDKLEKQVKILERYPDIGLVYCGTVLIDENNNITGKQPLITYSGNVIKQLIMTNFLYNGSCPLFRKNCLEKAGYFDKTFKRMTDWDFYLQMAIHYKFHGINEYLLKYRIHNETMSKDFKSYETYGIQILEKFFNSHHLDDEYLKYKNRAIALRYRYLGRRFLDNNQLSQAREYFKQALKTDYSLYFQGDCLAFYLLGHLPQDVISGLKSLKKKKTIPDKAFTMEKI